MKKIFVLLLAVAGGFAAFAQEAHYQQAIGIKVPGGFSVTYKKFFDDAHNVEAQAMFWQKGFRAVALYEFNFYSFDVEGLSWFVGPGAHLGFWKEQYKEESGSSADLGIDGIIGLDYQFRDIPINISLDWQPAISLVGSAGVTPAYGGLGIRYTF